MSTSTDSPGSPTTTSGPGPHSSASPLGPELRWELLRRLDEYQRVAERLSKSSYRDYLNFVTIDSRPEPRPFRQIAEDWQWMQANTLTPAMERVAGLRTDYDGPTRFWLTYPRGHDKSSSIGRAMNWLLGFARRPNLRLYAAAADKDQAAQIADFMRVEGQLNPWLGGLIKHHSFNVYGQNGGQLKILSADAAGVFGSKPDVVVCDELTHWPQTDAGRGLFFNLYSGMEKRDDSIMVVITNAGVRNTWQWDFLQSVRKNPRWLVYEAPGPVSSYMSPEKVAQMRADLPKALGDRVIGNRWVDPGEDANYITPAEAQACETLGGKMGLCYQPAGRQGVDYVAAVDYGLVKDRTVLAVMHRRMDGVVVVDKMDVWQGVSGVPVRADDVMEWMARADRDFFKPAFVVDSYQLEPVIQRLPHLNIERFEYRGGKGNYEAAANLLSLVRGGLMAWYPGCGKHADGSSLVSELREVVIKTMSYGYRIDHELSKYDDRVIALAMGALRVCRGGPGGFGAVGDLIRGRWF
jgi:hypothetical protein